MYREVVSMQEDVRKKGRVASAKSKQARADAFALDMARLLTRHAGQSLNAIARDFNAKRVPTASGKGTWTARTVSNLQARLSALHERTAEKTREEENGVGKAARDSEGTMGERAREADRIATARAKVAAMAEANAAARARLAQRRADATKVKKEGRAD
jgi:hypothetical protein